MIKIQVKPNKKARTFTIRVYDNGEIISKYRTIQYSKSEFQDMEDMTENDWKWFLRSRDEYFKMR